MTRLVPATEQDYRFATTDYVVDTVTLPDVDSEFGYPATNRAMVAKVAIFDTLNAGQDRGFGVLVTRPSEPLTEEFSVKDFHSLVVSYKRQGVKLEREEGGIPELGWMLSEAGFAGFWGIFRIAGERLMVGRRVFFAAGKGRIV